MNKSLVFAVIGCMVFSTASGNEASEIRESAAMMARAEHALQQKDIKGYCAATVGRADYAGYVERACQYGVKLKVKTPQDCGPEKIASEVRNDRAQCRAMSSAEFNETVSRQPERRAEWIKMVRAKGVDAEKLLQEELEKLR
jgi:hypothetical protein